MTTEGVCSPIGVHMSLLFISLLIMKSSDHPAPGHFAPAEFKTEKPSQGHAGQPQSARDMATLPPLPAEDSPSKSPNKADQEFDLKSKRSEQLEENEFFEFVSPKAGYVSRSLHNMERDVVTLFGAFKALVMHSWGLESFLIMSLAVGSTCFFCYYKENGAYLAAKLDFSIIASAIIFPVTFIIGETFRKREFAIQKLADIKALVCQIYIALLIWRWNGNNTDLGPEWESDVKRITTRIVRLSVALLKLPTWSTNRHYLTRRGREFRKKVLAREAEILDHVTAHFTEMHYFVEDLKAKGLPGNEASRINQYNYFLQSGFESLLMIKTYRTPNIARAFIRCSVLVCPIFYGPYFSWVAGTIGQGGQTNIAFAICLTIITVMILLGLVHVQRVMEIWLVCMLHGPGTNFFVNKNATKDDEMEGITYRLERIEAMAATRKTKMFALTVQ